jgi:hypothetical protein
VAWVVGRDDFFDRQGGIGLDLLPVQYLRSGKSLADLEAQYAIKHRRHSRHPNLVLLKYNQVFSPMAETIVRQCRGLILDEAANWEPVCVPYFKFFNYGEPNAAEIDWATARVQEKLDGSLVALYHYKDSWEVATTGTPDGEGPTGHGFSFAELFRRTWLELGYRLPDPQAKDWCYLFELCTKYNRVIVPHQKPRLVLHGVRCRHAPYQEGYPEDEAADLGYECVKSFPMYNFDQVVASCETANPMECEGYVVRDFGFNRVKVKSPQYVAMAHLKDSMSARRLLEIIRANESQEFLAYFPEFKDEYDQIRSMYDQLVGELEAAYDDAKGIESQKDFAAQACRTRCSSALFSVRKGDSASVREHLAKATLQSVERALGVKYQLALNNHTKLAEAV